MANLGKRIGGMMLGTATIVCAIMYSVHFYNQSFYNSAIEFDSSVLECSDYTSEYTDSEGKIATSTNYTATILYQDKSGKEYRKTFNNETGSCNSLNGRIKVFYDPANPEDCRLPPVKALILHIIAGVFMGSGILVYFVLKDA